MQQNKRRREHRPGHRNQVFATHNNRRREQRPGHQDQLHAAQPSGAAGNGLEHHGEVPAARNEWRRGQRPGETLNYLHRFGHSGQLHAAHNKRRCGQRPWAPRPSTCGAQRAAPRKRPGATPNYLRYTTSAASGYGLGTTMKNLVNVGVGKNLAKACNTKAGHEFCSIPPCSEAAFVVNSKPKSSQVKLILSPMQRAKPKISARKTGRSMPHCVARWVWLLRVLRSGGK
jgi:hypothetical protein